MLTTGELARLLKVTAPTIIQWMESGRLPFERLGERGRRRIQEQDVRDYVQHNRLDPLSLEPTLWERVLAASRPTHEAPAVFLVDRDFRCIHWSSEAQQLLGWSAAELLGTSLEAVGARVPGMEVDLRALSDPPPGQDGQLSLHIEMRRRDGNWLPVELVLNWIRGREARLEGVAFVCAAMQ